MTAGLVLALFIEPGGSLRPAPQTVAYLECGGLEVRDAHKTSPHRHG